MSDRINVIRAPRDSDHAYFAISRALTQDRQLSYEARGVLAYLLSKPGDWIVRVQDLQKEGQCGRDRIYRILKELRDAGYLHRDQEHQPNGTFIWGPYRVYEQPFTEKADMVTPLPENTEMGQNGTLPQQEATQPFTPLPYTVKPDTVKPDTVNTHIYKEESSTDQRSLQIRDSTSSPAANGNGKRTPNREMVMMLMKKGVKSSKVANEIAMLDLDLGTVEQSIDNLIADKTSIEAVIGFLRTSPPEKDMPYPRAAAKKTPPPIRPTDRSDMLTPQQLAERAKTRRAER